MVVVHIRQIFRFRNVPRIQSRCLVAPPERFYQRSVDTSPTQHGMLAGYAPIRAKEELLKCDDDTAPELPYSMLPSSSSDSTMDLQKEETIEDEEADLLPKTGEPTDEYKLAELNGRAKLEGCGPRGSATEILFKYLRHRSTSANSLSNTYVTLFNFHSVDLAEKLIKKNVGNVVLVENQHHYANELKAFARTARRKQRANVEAYNAQQMAMFGQDKKKTGKVPTKLLPNKEFGHFTLKTCDIEEEVKNAWCEPSPILVATFPTITLQNNLLDFLRKSLVSHLCGLNKTRETLYSYGPVEVISFLNTQVLVSLLSGVDPSLSFSSHQHRRLSSLLHKLFRIQPIIDGESEPLIANFKKKTFMRTTHFNPEIPPVKPPTHEKKLRELGIPLSRLFGVSISPQRTIRIGHHFVGNHSDVEETSDVLGGLPRSALVQYAFFLALIGKVSNSTTVESAFGKLFPESGPQAARNLGASEKIGTVPNEGLEESFLTVAEELKVPEHWIRRELVLS